MQLRRAHLLRSFLAISVGLSLVFIQAAGASPTRRTTHAEHLWEAGRVVQLSDGDTPYVDIWGDGTKVKQSIRLIDVQATETAHKIGRQWEGKNWCHGPAATRRLLKLEPIGSTVHLYSERKSSENGGRRLRTVWAKQRNGHWVNVQQSMVADGYVIWFAMQPEDAHNYAYHVLADKAALQGHNVWDKTYCGYGPQQQAHLKVWVHWDANGADDLDNAHRNDEYIIVRNNGGQGTVDLSGWYLRESGPKFYQFPRGAKLAAGAELRVHTGRGTNNASNYYWGLSGSIFDQVATTTYGRSAGMGDGAFLLDPQGDFRAWSTYPCVLNCSVPFGGDVRISRVGATFAHLSAANRQYVDITNHGHTAASLAHLQLRSWPWNYVFPSWFTLGAGKTVRVHIVHGSHPANSARNLYWNPGVTIILNSTKTSTDEVDLSTLTDVRMSCWTWNRTRGPSATCNW